jgi:TetR/AcrR family transcriptional regulator, cholesterol catabolism regulator
MEQVRKVINTAWGMFRKFGVRSVSMDDVAREMSISKKTLYQCFRDKNELIVKTLDMDLELIESKVNVILDEEINPVKQVIKIAQFVSDYLKEINPSMLYDLQKYHPEIHKQFMEYRQNTFIEKVKNNLKIGIEQGYYRADLNLNYTANLYLCLMDQGPQILINLDNNTDQDYSKMYIHIVQYHLHAICTPKGLEEAAHFIQ